MNPPVATDRRTALFNGINPKTNMKTIILVILATASLARAVVFTGDASLSSPVWESGAVVASGSLTLQNTSAGDATFSAASWVVAGRLVLPNPGNYVVTARASSSSTSRSPRWAGGATPPGVR